MQYSGFIYRWIDTTNSKTYVGSHKGTIDDGYIGSGRLFKEAYNARPDDFDREILEYVIFNNREKLLKAEQNHLNENTWDNTYNVSKFAQHGGVIKHSEESKRKSSISNRGQKRSEESKMKMSLAGKGQIPWNVGKKHSPESIQKMRDAKLGKKHTTETIQKMKASQARRFGK